MTILFRKMKHNLLFGFHFYVFSLLINFCACAKYDGITVRLSHRDRGMNINYLNDLRRDVKASDMRELVSNYYTTFIILTCSVL